MYGRMEAAESPLLQYYSRMETLETPLTRIPDLGINLVWA